MVEDTHGAYLDHAAASPLDPRVRRVMARFLETEFGSPEGLHDQARGPAEALDTARTHVAALLGADSDGVIFTAGDTEARNLAVKGIAAANAHRGRHIVTTAVEHPATLAACRTLARGDFDLTVVGVDTEGRVDPRELAAAVRDDTILVSISHGQAEIGTVQEVPALVAAVKRAGYEAHAPAGDERDREQQRRAAAYEQELRAFRLSAVLALPFLVQMAAMFSGHQHDFLPQWLQLALATPVQFWLGRRFYVGAWNALRGGGANMDVLIALGTGIAYLYSAAVVATGSGHHVYFEASVSIITLILMGKLLEARARARTSAAIESLMNLQPQTARIERDGRVEVVPVGAIRVGDVFVVRPGDSVPVDGTVIDGASSVDEAMLTGESVPVSKQAGAPVFAATINHRGLLRCHATGVGADTALASIIRLVEP